MMILQHALKGYAIARIIFEPRHVLGGHRSVVAFAEDRCLKFGSYLPYLLRLTGGGPVQAIILVMQCMS